MRAIQSAVEPRLLGLGSPGRGLVRAHFTNLTLHSPRRRPSHHHPHHHPHPHPHHHHAAPIAGLSNHRWASSSTTPSAPSNRDRYQNAVAALLAALRQQDTVKLYFCLMDLTRGVRELDRDFSTVVYQIPATTFSEIIHAFDPFTIARELDSASGIRISYGAARNTPLGELINKWGVKVLYVRILHRLMLLYRARRRAYKFNDGPIARLLPDDYRILIRCAGATSDIMLAKSFYRELKPQGYLPWIHSELFADLVKVWYLTEPLYTRHDLNAVRLRPLDLYLPIPRAAMRRLRSIDTRRAKTEVHRFGQMVRERYYAEPVRAILKLKKPLDGLIKAAIRPNHPATEDENLICAFIKAKGRNGGIGTINKLLRVYWGIVVEQEDKEDRVVYRIGGGDTDDPPGSCIAPTEALLDAVVHGYGNSGEAQLAGDLIQYISKRFAIPIPDQVWSDLLAYARIHGSQPASQEWKIAGLPHKVTHRDYLFEIWQIATREPHHFQPRMEDYLELLKEHVGRHEVEVGRSRANPVQEWNLDLIRQVKTLYEELTRRLQEAWVDLMHTTRQGVPNHAAYRRYRLLQSRKHYAWHSLSYIGQRAIKHTSKIEQDDPRPLQYVPDLIRELSDFLPIRVKYRIATGYVEMDLGTFDWRRMLAQGQLVERGRNLGRGSREPALTLFGMQHPYHGEYQVIERPAVGPRPPGTAPSGEMSVFGLAREGKVFTGFRDSPSFRRFAAHRRVVPVNRAVGVPVDLEPGQSGSSALGEVVRMRR